MVKKAMKNIIKIFAILAITQVITTQIQAQANKQHTASINVGPELFAPENFRETHKIGTYFDGKRIFENFTSPTANFFDPIFAIPVKLGARYYVGNFYFLGEAGAIIMTRYSNTTKAVFTAGIGDKINIGRRKLDISARQEIWLGKNREELNMAVLRVAYEFNF
jgi:hypothetical protein